MRRFEDIWNTKNFQSKQKCSVGGSGWVTIRGKILFVIYSTDRGWDHVSVSTPSRCPTWEEMAEIKNIFFEPEELCVQYHPPRSQYVDLMKYCLHIWKPQGLSVPHPPKELVL